MSLLRTMIARINQKKKLRLTSALILILALNTVWELGNFRLVSGVMYTRIVILKVRLSII